MDNSRVTARSTEPFLFMGIARRKRTCHSLVVVFVYSFIFHRFIFLVVVVAVVLLQFSRYAFLIICFWLYHEKKSYKMESANERKKSNARATTTTKTKQLVVGYWDWIYLVHRNVYRTHTPHAHCTRDAGMVYPYAGAWLKRIPRASQHK